MKWPRKPVKTGRGFLGITPLLPAAGDRFSILISRPLRNIDRSIHQARTGEFNEDISINGPATCAHSASGSTGCAAACLNWRRIRAAFCATCRTN